MYPALCDAVGELHAGFAMAGETSAPVIHRDLKPSNIIVTGANYTSDDGLTFSSLVIIDLGIARVWRDGADADTVKFGTRPWVWADECTQRRLRTWRPVVLLLDGNRP